MKVLALLASPRKLGNTEILVEELFRSLPKEWEKNKVRLTELNIQNCTACYSCLAPDKKCVISDDLNHLLKQIKEANSIIIASPVYFLGAHSSIKKVTERLLCVLNKPEEFQNKNTIILETYGIEGWQGYAREELLCFARFLHLRVCGFLSVRADCPGDVVREEVFRHLDFLKDALLHGNTYFPDQENYKEICPVCLSSLLQKKKEGFYCVFCGSDSFSVSQRFSPEKMKEHAQLLEGIKQKYLDNRKFFYQIRQKYKN